MTNNKKVGKRKIPNLQIIYRYIRPTIRKVSAFGKEGQPYLCFSAFYPAVLFFCGLSHQAKDEWILCLVQRSVNVSFAIPSSLLIFHLFKPCGKQFLQTNQSPVPLLILYNSPWHWSERVLKPLRYAPRRIAKLQKTPCSLQYRLPCLAQRTFPVVVGFFR